MKIVIFIALFGLSMSMPTLLRKPRQADFSDVTVIRSDIGAPSPEGFAFNYELSDGTRREDQGNLTPEGFLVMSGSYSYISPDGTPITVTWVADQNGYRAESDAIPSAQFTSGGGLDSGIPKEPDFQPYAAPNLFEKGR